MSQQRAGLKIIASGAALLFLGRLWGLNVANTPFPRLALTAHIGAMNEGVSHPQQLISRAIDCRSMDGPRGKVRYFHIDTIFVAQVA